MKQCKTCSAVVPSNADVCTSCGYSNFFNTNKKICSCGKVNKMESGFCELCGKDFSVKVTPPRPAAPLPKPKPMPAPRKVRPAPFKPAPAPAPEPVYAPAPVYAPPPAPAYAPQPAPAYAPQPAAYAPPPAYAQPAPVYAPPPAYAPQPAPVYAPPPAYAPAPAPAPVPAATPAPAPAAAPIAVPPPAEPPMPVEIPAPIAASPAPVEIPAPAPTPAPAETLVPAAEFVSVTAPVVAERSAETATESVSEPRASAADLYPEPAKPAPEPSYSEYSAIKTEPEFPEGYEEQARPVSDAAETKKSAASPQSDEGYLDRGKPKRKRASGGAYAVSLILTFISLIAAASLLLTFFKSGDAGFAGFSAIFTAFRDITKVTVKFNATPDIIKFVNLENYELFASTGKEGFLLTLIPYCFAGVLLATVVSALTSLFSFRHKKAAKIILLVLDAVAILLTAYLVLTAILVFELALMEVISLGAYVLAGLLLVHLFLTLFGFRPKKKEQL